MKSNNRSMLWDRAAAQGHAAPELTTLAGHEPLGTHLLEPGPDDGDPMLDGGDAVRVAGGQDDLSHPHCCVHVHPLLFHFLHELLGEGHTRARCEGLAHGRGHPALPAPTLHPSASSAWEHFSPELVAHIIFLSNWCLFFFSFNKANLISLHPLKHKTQEFKQGPNGLFCSIVAHKFCSGCSKKRRQRAAPCSWLLPLTPEGSSTL